MRANTSRAEELVAAAANCLVGQDPDGVRDILNQLSERPHGGLYQHTNGAKLVWGNIERLLGSSGHVQIADIGSAIMQYQLPRSQPPRYVVLVDSLRKAGAFPCGVSAEAANILEEVKGKADLAVIENDVIREVSVKQPNAREVKLGQQSRREEYDFSVGTTVLNGGKNLPGLREGIAALTDRLDKIVRPFSLSENQWSKLNADDKRIAAAKHSFPDQWFEVVQKSMIQSGQELDNFFTAAFSGSGREHSYNLGVLLSHRLIGGVTEGHEEWITSARGPFRLDLAIQRLAEMNMLRVKWARRPSKSGKDSWVVSAEVSAKRYVICKVEPSFDGMKPNVSQTKGVIYYFQEGSGVRTPDEGSVWDLLTDLSA